MSEAVRPVSPEQQLPPMEVERCWRCGAELGRLASSRAPYLSPNVRITGNDVGPKEEVVVVSDSPIKERVQELGKIVTNFRSNTLRRGKPTTKHDVNLKGAGVRKPVKPKGKGTFTDSKTRSVYTKQGIYLVETVLPSLGLSVKIQGEPVDSDARESD